MIHNGVVVDKDPYFVIDPITRIITNQSTNKVNIIQFDHNSERFTFSMPRIVEGHDMSECNVVQVHYANTDAVTMEQTTGIYTVDDLQIDENDNETITLSWLLSQNVTQRVGKLEFLIRFACTDGESNIMYAWNTAIFDTIKVAKGMNNTDIIDQTYPDVLVAKEDRLNKVYTITGNETYEQYPTVLAVKEYLRKNGGGLTEDDMRDILAGQIDVGYVTVSSNGRITTPAIYISDGVPDWRGLVQYDGSGSEITMEQTLATKSDKTNIVDSSSGLLSNNTECRIGTLESPYTFVLPELDVIDNGYISSITFDTGTTAPELHYNTNIRWSGDDLSDNLFVPVENKHYTIVFWYDGTYLNGVVRSVEI